MTVTGRRWQRPSRKCLWWCAKDHQCTARHGYPGGEHRSDTMSWNTRYGRLTAVRTEQLSGTGWLDVRAVIRLPLNEAEAHRQASQLAVQIDAAIRKVQALPEAPTRKEIPA